MKTVNNIRDKINSYALLFIKKKGRSPQTPELKNTDSDKGNRVQNM